MKGGRTYHEKRPLEKSRPVLVQPLSESIHNDHPITLSREEMRTSSGRIRGDGSSSTVTCFRGFEPFPAPDCASCNILVLSWESMPATLRFRCGPSMSDSTLELKAKIHHLLTEARMVFQGLRRCWGFNSS